MLKRFITLLLILSIASAAIFAEEKEEPAKTGLVSVNFLGPVLGLYTGYYESMINNKMSIMIEPYYMNIKLGILGSLANTASTYSQTQTTLPDLWLAGSRGGINYYLGDKPLEGFFIGGAAEAAYMYIGNSAANISGFVLGAQARGGYRWIWDWFALDIQGGTTYTAALFDASTVSSTTTFAQAIGVKPFFGLGLAVAF